MYDQEAQQASGGQSNSQDAGASQDPILPPVQTGSDADDAGQVMDNGQTIPTNRSLIATPDQAADSDLIEKEWVLKAKQIVDHTAEDPFKQQEELSKMKADYLKKRYNKDLGSPV